MKKLLYICLLLPLVAFQSCKKAHSPGDNYDFSNSLPPYVAFKSTADVKVKLAADHATAGSATFAFVMRTGMEQTVTVSYSVSGALTLTGQTVVIAKETVTSPNVVINVPAGTAPGTAIIKLDKAVTADGKTLTLGADNNAAKQVANIIITQL
jgi:hypothetical protein